MSDKSHENFDIHSTTDAQEDAAADVGLSAVDYFELIVQRASEGEIDSETKERYVTTMWAKLRQECPSVFASTFLRTYDKEPSATKREMETIWENRHHTPIDTTRTELPFGGGMFGLGTSDR